MATMCPVEPPLWTSSSLVFFCGFSESLEQPLLLTDWKCCLLGRQDRQAAFQSWNLSEIYVWTHNSWNTIIIILSVYIFIIVCLQNILGRKLSDLFLNFFTHFNVTLRVCARETNPCSGCSFNTIVAPNAYTGVCPPMLCLWSSLQLLPIFTQIIV